MKLPFAAALLLHLSWTVFLNASPGEQRSDLRAKELVRQGLAAEGGESALRAIRSVHWQAVGYRNQLEESERPEGPYITEFQNVVETHDHAGRRFRNVTELTVYPAFTGSQGYVVSGDIAMRFAGARQAPGTAQQVEVAHERLALSPERLLLTALDASDLHAEPDEALQGLSQHVVAFTLDGSPARIFLNPYTHLPTAVDYSGPLAHSGFWTYWGDVTQRVSYGFWWLAKGGIHLPMQWNTETNGRPDSMYSIKQLTLDGPLDETELSIPEAVKQRYNADPALGDIEQRPLGMPGQPASELRPGIVLIPGAWNATFVRQSDGIVILEAPISSGYSARVIAEAKRRFPEMPIKAVITTSDSWPHLAGIREYVARGVPIYALDLNQPILTRFILDKRTVHPDALARSARKPKFHLVSGKTVLGTGPNRMEIYPLRGETSERQMMVYFPEYKLLYGSDPFQQMPDGGYFYPQTVSEVTAAVEREHLAVEQFFMMHIGLTNWSELGPALEKAARTNTPDGKL